MTAYPPDDEPAPLDDTIRVAVFTDPVQPDFDVSDEYGASAYDEAFRAAVEERAAFIQGVLLDAHLTVGRELARLLSQWMGFVVRPLPRPWKGGRAGVRFRQRRRR